MSGVRPVSTGGAGRVPRGLTPRRFTVTVEQGSSWATIVPTRLGVENSVDGVHEQGVRYSQNEDAEWSDGLGEYTLSI